MRTQDKIYFWTILFMILLTAAAWNISADQNSIQIGPGDKNRQTLANHTVPFSDDFESGDLAGWQINVGGSGDTPLVRADSSLQGGASPHSGTWVAYLGDSTAGSYAHSTMDLVMDLSALGSAELRFWWITYSLTSSEYIRLDIWDGSWHDDVNGWAYTGTTWQEKVLDLSSYKLIDGFIIRFHSYMNYSEGSDASYVDDVTVTGVTADDLDISPRESFQSGGPVGGPFTPSSKTYTLANTGGSSLDWEASCTVDWLDISPNTGTLAPGAFVDVDVSLNAKADALPGGSYSDIVSFSNKTSGITQNRDVSLSVGIRNILCYVQYGDLSREVPNTFTAIDSVSTRYVRTDFSDYTQLDSLIAGQDVLLIPEQESASSSQLETVGTAWASTLDSFVSNGGVVIQCDFAGHHQILPSAGLLPITGSSKITDAPLTIADPSDPVASGVSDYQAGNGSSSYSCSEGNVVVETSGGVPVVINKTYGLGSVVAIGHDYFESNTDQDRIVGNAVFNLPPILDDLQITPGTDFSSQGREGGPFTPEKITYTLTNSGSASLNWEAGKTAAWLDLSPASGALAPGAKVNVDVAINTGANSLPGGKYTDTVSFTNKTSGNTMKRDVLLSVEVSATLPFTEDFESGSLEPYWKITGTAEYRTQVTTANGPHAGSYHLTMDDTASNSTYSRNELTLSIDLDNYENVQLSFWAREWGDEAHGPPTTPFTNGADFDGVAVSQDGTTWYEVQGLRNLTSVYSQIIVDLDAALAVHGLSYNSTFKLRFNQYDNYPISSDGIGLDEISITGNVKDDLNVTPPEDFDSTGQTGGPFTPQCKTYTLENRGSSDVVWEASKTQTWVDVSPLGGTITPGSTTNVELCINDEAKGFPKGNYTDVLSVKNTASGYIQTRDITLDIYPPPPIIRVVVPNPLEATLYQDQQVSFTPGFTIHNDGVDDLNYTIDIGYGALAAGNEKSGSVRGGTPAPDRVNEALESFIARSGILEEPITVSRTTEQGETREITLTDPEDIAGVKTATDLGVKTASTLDVAICGADHLDYMTDVQTKLLGTGLFNSVSIVDVDTATPTLPELQVFDSVIVYQNTGYNDPDAMGNVLADYADAGGGVVSMVYEIGGALNPSLGGRWATGGYVLMDRPNNVRGQSYLGTVHDPTHPIMAGVTSFDGGTNSSRPEATTVYAGVTRIADWSDGRPLVAVKEMGGVPLAAVTFFPPSSDTGTSSWNPATDGDLLMGNALCWVAGSFPSGWLTVEEPLTGTIAGSGNEEKDVGMDSTGMDPGIYEATITIQSNDPVNPTVEVPAKLTVLLDDLLITPGEALSSRGPKGGPFDPSSKTYELKNAGTSPLEWSASVKDNWLGLSLSGGILDPGEKISVVLELTAQAALLPGGTYESGVTFTNNTSGVKQTRDASLSVESAATMPFIEDFEGGSPLDPYWKITGTAEYRTQVTSLNDPHGGSYHLTMDDFIMDSTYSRNELTLTIDLENYENVSLSFFAREWGDEAHGPPPTPFTGGADFDGVAVSQDGTSWYEIQDLRTLSSSYSQITVNLDSAVSAHGLSYNSTFKIRFNQYDNYPISSDGIGLDDIQITGDVKDDMVVTPPEHLFSSGLEGGPFDPPSKSYTLTNQGTASIDWEATRSQNWIDVDPASGALGTGESAVVTVSFNANAGALAPGDYYDNVLFTNNTSGISQGRNVTLKVIEITGEIEVTDSIPPPDDLAMPFGPVIVGDSRSEQITITNTDPSHNLTVTEISLGREYFENFDDGQAQNWDEDLTDNWKVVSGEYRAATAVEDFMTATYAGSEWDDLSVEMKCRRSGSTTKAASVVLRASADFDDEIGSGYIFQINTSGSYAVWKQVGGSWSWLQSWISSSSIVPGTNTLLASAMGNNLTFYINGAPVWSGTDSTLTSGRIGLMGFSGGDCIHFFDDVKVTEPVTTPVDIGEEQEWYNNHPLGGGDPRECPAGNTAQTFPELPEGNDNLLPRLAGVFQIPDLSSVLPLTLGPGEDFSFDVTYTPQAYQADESGVVIKSNDFDEPEVEVLLSGEGVPDLLGVSPVTGFSSRGHPGGPFKPQSTDYLLENNGAIPMDWEIVNFPSWITVAPKSGTLPTGGSTNVRVSFAAPAYTLPVGNHTGKLVFRNLNSGHFQTRDVRLEVFTSSEIRVDPDSLLVRLKPEQVTTRTLTIGNAGDGDLEFSLKTRETGRVVLSRSPAMTADKSNSLVMEYSFPSPVADERGDYDLFTMEGLELYEREGAPAVPVKPVQILIPYGKELSDIRVTPLGIEDLPGTYHLAPGERPFPLSHPELVMDLTPDPAIYEQDTPWPGKDFTDAGIHSRRGYRICYLNLFPLQYTPAAGRVSCCSSMLVEISFEERSKPNMVKPSKTVLEALKRSVDNPSSLDSYNPAAIDNVKGKMGALPPGGPYKYIIITSEALKGAAAPYNFQALRDSKTAKGLPATIITTEWIYANYDGTRPSGGEDDQTRIRNFLIEAYQNWGTEYVLLGGGNPIVPARMFWVQAADETDTMPVDMYYGCLDPEACTFDSDGDGRYGEPTDGVGGADVDLAAEIYVGRATVENATELANFIRKTFAYDATNAEYLPRIAMLGEHLGFGGVAEYAKNAMEQIRLGGDYDGYITTGFENHTRIDFIDFVTEDCISGVCWPLYDKDGSWPKADLITLMNSGIHVFNHLGHANETYCMKLNTSSLSSLTNTDSFFVYSQGCMPGWFDKSNCFADVITTMEQGAFAVVMNARYGWGKRNSTDGPSQRFDRQFWDAVLEEDMLQLGRANQDSKEDNLWDINGSCIRWCCYELNLFGDPEQEFRFPEKCKWLRVNPEAGKVAPSTDSNVDVGFYAGNLANGTYDGEIIISSNDKDTPTTRVKVTMVISEDDLMVSPKTGLDSMGPEGMPFEFDPLSKSYTVTNNGTSPLNWSVEKTADWIDLSSTGGILAPGDTAALDIDINALAASQAAGRHTTQVTFTNLGNGYTIKREVHLDVIARGSAEVFEWDGISSPQKAGDPINVKITARDSVGYTAVSFESTVNLSATQGGLAGSSSIVITECDPNTPDVLEIQNVSGGSVNTSGWVVAISDDYSVINDVNSILWNLPDSMAEGEILYKTDYSSDNYWGSNMFWNNTASCWAMIVDDKGRVVDFVAWGWNASAISGMNPTINGFSITIGDKWTGDAVPTGGTGSIQRQGDEDHDDSTDFIWSSSTSKGVQNSGLTVPFTGGRIPITITPDTSGAFAAGEWQGDVAVIETGKGVILKADDGSGHTGEGDPFDVLKTTPTPTPTPTPSSDKILEYLLGKPEGIAEDCNRDGCVDVSDLLVRIMDGR